MDQKQSIRSPWPSQPLEHSNAVEHRLTTLEISDEGQRAFNTKVKKRLYWIEKALQVMAGVLYMLVNGKAHADWAPPIAELLIKLIRMSP
jgi:hypothetical protein